MGTCSTQIAILLFFFSCSTFVSLARGLELQPFSAVGSPTAKSLEKKLLLMYRAFDGLVLELLPNVSKTFCLLHL